MNFTNRAVRYMMSFPRATLPALKAGVFPCYRHPQSSFPMPDDREKE